MKERDTNNLSFPQLAQIISRNTAEAFLENLAECLNLLESQGRTKQNVRLEIRTYDWFIRIRNESETCFSADGITLNYLFNECLYDALRENKQSYKLFCQKYGYKKNIPNKITTIFISLNTIRNMHIYKDLKAGTPIYLIQKKYNLHSKSSIYRVAKKHEMQYSATCNDKNNATC